MEVMVNSGYSWDGFRLPDEVEDDVQRSPYYEYVNAVVAPDKEVGIRGPRRPREDSVTWEVRRDTGKIQRGRGHLLHGDREVPG